MEMWLWFLCLDSLIERGRREREKHSRELDSSRSASNEMKEVDGYRLLNRLDHWYHSHSQFVWPRQSSSNRYLTAHQLANWKTFYCCIGGAMEQIDRSIGSGREVEEQLRVLFVWLSNQTVCLLLSSCGGDSSSRVNAEISAPALSNVVYWYQFPLIYDQHLLRCRVSATFRRAISASKRRNLY